MKKSLIALAVAGSFAAPAFAATSNVDIYGILNIAIQDTNADNKDMAIVDNVSRIGFKGTEDLGGGLKAVWQIEQALTSNPSESGNAVGGNTLAGRNTFVGLAGGFGTVLMGRHDTPYKLGTASLDIFADTIGDYNGGGSGFMGARLGGDTLLANAHDYRSPQALAYISPTWSGFHFAVAAVMTNDSANGNDDKSVDAVSATGVYMNGPLFASYSFQKADNATAFLNSTTLSKFQGVLGGSASAGKSTAHKLGASYAFGDAKVGGVYEMVKVDDVLFSGVQMKRTAWLLNGTYNMGPIVLKAEYGQAKYGSDLDFLDKTKIWALGADYNLSKRTTAYLVYAHEKNSDFNFIASGDDKAASGWNLGVKHSF
jgi:predicted porin